MAWRTVGTHVVLPTSVTKQNELATLQVGAVVELAGRRVTTFAATNGSDVVTELVVHSRVKEVERAFPQALIGEDFAVANDAAVELVDLVKAPILHHRRQHFATHATRAVGNYGSIL